jgi:UDP-glucuronate 4-epimerase
LNDYYDVRLKQARLETLSPYPNFEFRKIDLADRDSTRETFEAFRPDRVVHLAAQAGVRYSLVNPQAYTRSNIDGFLNVLEGVRHLGTEHLVYASSSSVYGANTQLPYAVSQRTDTPLSLYAATKKANEAMGYAYSHLYGIPMTGLRFFTVYGPWGRPDMAAWLFTKKILAGEPIELFNAGDHRRDFTYIDDIVEGVVRVLDRPAPFHRLYNIGNHEPVRLTDFVATLESALGVAAVKRLMPASPGDMHETFADVEDFIRDFGYRPQVSLRVGLANFVAWFRNYHSAAAEAKLDSHVTARPHQS